MPETQVDTNLSPQGLGNSDAVVLGTFSGLLSEQTEQVQAGVASLRAGLKSHQDGYAGLPTKIQLTMSCGTVIQSETRAINNGAVPSTGDVSLILSHWNHMQFEWSIVEIVGDEMTVKVHRNPPETQQIWRKVSPTIVPPTT